MSSLTRLLPLLLLLLFPPLNILTTVILPGATPDALDPPTVPILLPLLPSWVSATVLALHPCRSPSALQGQCITSCTPYILPTFNRSRRTCLIYLCEVPLACGKLLIPPHLAAELRPHSHTNQMCKQKMYEPNCCPLPCMYFLCLNLSIIPASIPGLIFINYTHTHTHTRTPSQLWHFTQYMQHYSPVYTRSAH